MPRNKYHDTPVVEFHETFGHPVSWSPTVPDAETRRLRCALLLEEVLEFCTASGFVVREVEVNNEVKLELFSFDGTAEAAATSLTEAADALADIRYVTDGAALVWGIPLEKCLREVHRSNMSKTGPDGKPLLRDDGKILKGPNFTPPAIAEILALYSGISNESKL